MFDLEYFVSVCKQYIPQIPLVNLRNFQDLRNFCFSYKIYLTIGGNIFGDYKNSILHIIGFLSNNTLITLSVQHSDKFINHIYSPFPGFIPLHRAERQGTKPEYRENQVWFQDKISSGQVGNLLLRASQKLE